MTGLDQITIERYSLALEVSPVAMMLVDGTGKIVLANAVAHDLFEWAANGLIGEQVESLLPEDLRGGHPQLRQGYFSRPTKRAMGIGRELQGCTRTGQRIALELGLEPVRNGAETWALVTAIDIRERKLHEQRLHVAMDAAASAMVMVTEEGAIIFANRAAGRLFGYAIEDLMDQPISMLVPHALRRGHEVLAADFFATGTARQMATGRDVLALRQDGTEFPVEITLTPVELDDQPAVLSTITDLSERVRAAKALAAANAELATINADLTQFAYSASHDLKAPLTSIRGLLGFCVEDLEGRNFEVLKENLERASEISKRSSERVEQVLRVARAGFEGLSPEEFDLEPLVREVCADLTSGQDHDIDLRLTFDHRGPIRTERPTLKIILENLVSNAVRYHDETVAEHIIEVRCRVVDGKLIIDVADNGTGISPENQTAIFEMFKRFDTRSQDGLGLSLVKKQIDRLGGEISVESEEGKGAHFTVIIPLPG